MSETSTLLAHCGTTKVDRDFLKTIPTPEATRTHQPISHWDLVNELIISLGFRHINVIRDEYAVSPDGMKLFGVMDLDYEFTGARFSLGIRNANNRTMSLGLVIGYRVFCCDNLCFQGDYKPILARHSKSLQLQDILSVGLDKTQRNFEPLKRTIGEWKANQLTDEQAKLILYEAFVEGKLKAPAKLLKPAHDAYFNPPHEEFEERTLWSLSNGLTEAIKTLKPIQQFQAATKVSPFLNQYVQPF